MVYWGIRRGRGTSVDAFNTGTQGFKNVENKQNILKLEKGTNMGEKTILARLAVAFPGSVGRIPRVVLYAYSERDSR